MQFQSFFRLIAWRPFLFCLPYRIKLHQLYLCMLQWPLSFPSFWYTTCPYNKYNIYKYSICFIFQIYHMAAIFICWPYHHIFTPIILICIVMTSPWYFLHFDILHVHITNIFNFQQFLDWSYGGHFEFPSIWRGETQLFSC